MIVDADCGPASTGALKERTLPLEELFFGAMTEFALWYLWYLGPDNTLNWKTVSGLDMLL